MLLILTSLILVLIMPLPIYIKSNVHLLLRPDDTSSDIGIKCIMYAQVFHSHTGSVSSFSYTTGLVVIMITYKLIHLLTTPS